MFIDLIVYVCTIISLCLAQYRGVKKVEEENFYNAYRYHCYSRSYYLCFEAVYKSEPTIDDGIYYD